MCIVTKISTDYDNAILSLFLFIYLFIFIFSFIYLFFYFFFFAFFFFLFFFFFAFFFFFFVFFFFFFFSFSIDFFVSLRLRLSFLCLQPEKRLQALISISQSKNSRRMFALSVCKTLHVSLAHAHLCRFCTTRLI